MFITASDDLPTTATSMTPRPYSDRSVLPRDSSNSSVSIESDTTPTTADVSPGTLSATTTPSPIDQGILTEGGTNSPEILEEEYEVLPPNTDFYPTPADSMPFDHAFPDFIRQLTNERNLANVHSLRLRVISSLVSLQRMSFFTINLRELDLEGSILGSLRDIGCNLKFLQVLKVGNCQLDSLDGTFGLTSLRKLYAQRNQITDVSPCSNLPHIQHIDLSYNRIRNIAYAGFLSVCRKLKSVVFAGNPAAQLSDYRSQVKRLLPRLKSLDDELFGDEENEDDPTSDIRLGELEEDLAESTEDEQNNSASGKEELCSQSECSRISNKADSAKDHLDINENYDFEVQEILKYDSTRGGKGSLLSLRKERDECKQFMGTRPRRSVNINYEETEDLADNSQGSGSCQPGGAGNSLTLPPLSTCDKESKKKLALDKEPTFLGPTIRSDKLKSKFGEKSNSFSPTGDLEILMPSDCENVKTAPKPRALTKLERPSTASSSGTSCHNVSGETEKDAVRKRPCTAGSEPLPYDSADLETVARKSLTSGLPICGNLAVAMRNRKKQQQEREELEMLRARESDEVECSGM